MNYSFFCTEREREREREIERGVGGGGERGGETERAIITPPPQESMMNSRAKHDALFLSLKRGLGEG